MWFLMNNCLNKKSEKWHKVEDLEDLFSWKNLRLVSSQDEGSEEHDKGTTATLEKPKLKKPPLYKVIMLNDDYTPMEFVVEMLQVYFSKTQEQATEIMLHIHQRGLGICGLYTYEIAESKANQVLDKARKNQHPLQIKLEKE